MEVDQVLPRDRFERRLGGVLGGEVVVAAEEALEFALLDGRCVVVAALHLLQRLALGQLEPALVEARIAQHIDEQGEARVDVLGEAIERRLAGDVADSGIDRRRQERDFIVKNVGALGFGSAGPHLRAGQLRQADLLCGLEIIAGANQHRDGDEWKVMVLDEKRGCAV